MTGHRPCAWLSVWVACLTLQILLSVPARAGSDGLTPTAPERQILVMLKEVRRPHFRPDESYGGAYNADKQPTDLRARIDVLNQRHGLKTLEHWPMPALKVRCYLEQLTKGQDLATLLDDLSKDENVESVEVVQNYRTLGRDDSYYPMQTNAKALQLDALHARATGRGVRVAVIDTAIEARHPDLAGRLVDQQDFTGQPPASSEAHGTEVAGLLAASADNHVGIVGVAPEASLLGLRACWQSSVTATESRCNSFTLAKSLQYAISRDAQVINMSLSGPPDRLLERLIVQAQQRGAVVVAALDMTDPGSSFPAKLPDVVAVSCCAAPEASALRALQGNGHVLIQAPGTRVLTTTPQASWGFVTGSSFATAQVSGLMALIAQASPHLTSSALQKWLRQNQQPTPSSEALSLDTNALIRALSDKLALAGQSPLASPDER